MMSLNQLLRQQHPQKTVRTPPALLPDCPVHDCHCPDYNHLYHDGLDLSHHVCIYGCSLSSTSFHFSKIIHCVCHREERHHCFLQVTPSTMVADNLFLRAYKDFTNRYHTVLPDSLDPNVATAQAVKLYAKLSNKDVIPANFETARNLLHITNDVHIFLTKLLCLVHPILSTL